MQMCDDDNFVDYSGEHLARPAESKPERPSQEQVSKAKYQRGSRPKLGSESSRDRRSRDANSNDTAKREILIPSILGSSGFVPFNLIFREGREEEPGETIAVEIVKEFPVWRRAL